MLTHSAQSIVVPTDEALRPMPARSAQMPLARPVLQRAGPCAADPTEPGSTQLSVRWARDEDDVRAAQRLRYQVFADEMGARLSCPPGTPAGLDVDRFDAFCEHLTVWATPEDDESAGQVVGTYRVLTPSGMQRAGGFYSETEFDLDRLQDLRPRLAELGRSCTAPGWRQGGVVMMLWSALASFLHRNGLDTVIGCASVGMRDGGHQAASLWQALARAHLVAPERRVTPRLPLPVDRLDSGQPVDLPPLIKGYLKCGAQVLGAPAWDPDFGVADLPMLLSLEQLPAAYRRRLLRD